MYINSNESRRIGVRNRYSSSHDSDREGDLKIEAITECAWDLRDRINNNKRTKEEVSEALDRTFPQRVIDLYKNTQKRDAKQIREQLQELEQKRKDLEKIGLIVDDRETLRFSSDEDFPTDALPVLEIYIEDNKKKLAAYDKLKVQIDLLLKAINESNAFANKKLVIQTNKSHSINPYAALKAAPKALKFLTNDGREIPLERLSSGEKHAVILFYNLIFNSKEDSLVMIDEPEISLHISWQQHFISSLLEICKENRLYAVIATHSPDIVNGHWDLLVNLDGTPVDEDDEED
ncbi:AAA domain-containing protein, putative AbiEii toxin, Type IV TA system [Butyrivibrio proteoclasticus]|uniref:AAA domain-containing protein, putative AbiEii toxin, Type IV TA system n=1 Tax=Butyrivibrio proteoclasticus TaxID=43305 RepID=A0A1I5YUV3_9FIRM|nr:AAA family ATPase [Butyrivibrio proteoclasticus]SFQ47617.1 AAA domain-containing protein, putative AbiEii toxin, Type IV TA system [Butyrivibrio proteoclasticus]